MTDQASWQQKMRLSPVSGPVLPPMQLPDYRVWQAQREQCRRCDHVRYGGKYGGQRCVAVSQTPGVVMPCLNMRDPDAACGPGALLFKPLNRPLGTREPT